MDLGDKDVLLRLQAHPETLQFVMKLTDTELKSFAQILDWPAPRLARLRDQPWHAGILHKMWDLAADRESFFKTYLSIYDTAADSVNVLDAFSQGQLDSKRWLIDTAIGLGIPLGRTWVLCGWIGTLSYLMFTRSDDLKLTSVRSFDIDPNCEELAEKLNKENVKAGWRFKAFTKDVNLLDYDCFEWSVWSTVNNRMSHPIQDAADTIINTSCDHMGSDRSWWDRIPAGKLVILQNNNWHENDQHDNSTTDLDSFKAMYPFGELLYAGQLDCTLYQRFMLIGRK